MTKFLAALIVPVATAAFADPTPRPVIGHCILENGNRRAAVEFQPKATQTPVPTATPKPTVSPMPCEQIGGTKDYSAGDEKLLCFDAGAKRPLMEVSVKGQPSYAGELAVQLQAPSGARYNAIASQPNTILPWEPGRWYLSTKLLWGTPTNFVFTPR